MCSSATRFAATALDVARTFEGWHTVGSWTVTIGAWCKRLTLALELQSKWMSSYIALRWFPERRIPEASPICPIQTVVQATVQLKHLFAKLHFPWLLDQWARFVATSASFRIFIFGQSLDENDDEMHNASRIRSERLGQLSETQFNPESALQTPDSSGLTGRNTIVALYSCSLVVQNMLRSLLNAARHFQAFPNQNWSSAANAMPEGWFWRNPERHQFFIYWISCWCRRSFEF